VGERAFVAVADGIYYIPSPGPDGAGSVNFYEFASGKKHLIAPPKREIFGSMTVSPDRKTILFSVLSRTGSNVMLDTCMRVDLVWHMETDGTPEPSRRLSVYAPSRHYQIQADISGPKFRDSQGDALTVCSRS
jgi:hypothetical protein